MSAKKKQNTVVFCQHCGCYFLNTESDRVKAHTRTSRLSQRNSPLNTTPTSSRHEVKSGDVNTPKVSNMTPTNIAEETCSHGDVLNRDESIQCVVPRVGMCAVPYQLHKREIFLPSESTGWERRHIMLVNNDTLTQLGVLPRSPVVLQSTTERSSNDIIHSNAFIIWPCSEVPQMRVSYADDTESRLLRIIAARPRQLAALKLSLSLNDTISNDFKARLQAKKDDHFTYYLKSYLSNAYLRRDASVMVQFYLLNLKFHVVEAHLIGGEDTEIEMNRLSLSSKHSTKDNDVLSVTIDTDIQLEFDDDDNNNLL